MDADPPPAAAEATEKAAGDKPVDAATATAATDATVPDGNGAAPKEGEGAKKKSFPRCQLRLRLDSGCYLARIAKDDKGDNEKEEKEKANGDVVVAAGQASAGDALLLPQELAAERGWLTDEHAAALEKKLVEAASRLGNAAPPLWSLRSEGVSRVFFLLMIFRRRRRRRRRRFVERQRSWQRFGWRQHSVGIALLSSEPLGTGKRRLVLAIARLHPSIEPVDEKRNRGKEAGIFRHRRFFGRRRFLLRVFSLSPSTSSSSLFSFSFAHRRAPLPLSLSPKP